MCALHQNSDRQDISGLLLLVTATARTLREATALAATTAATAITTEATTATEATATAPTTLTVAAVAALDRLETVISRGGRVVLLSRLGGRVVISPALRVGRGRGSSRGGIHAGLGLARVAGDLNILLLRGRRLVASVPLALASGGVGSLIPSLRIRRSAGARLSASRRGLMNIAVGQDRSSGLLCRGIRSSLSARLSFGLELGLYSLLSGGLGGSLSLNKRSVVGNSSLLNLGN